MHVNSRLRPTEVIPRIRKTVYDPCSDTFETTVHVKVTLLYNLFPYMDRVFLFKVLVNVCNTVYLSVLSSLMVDISLAPHAAFLRGSSQRLGRRARNI